MLKDITADNIYIVCGHTDMQKCSKLEATPNKARLTALFGIALNKAYQRSEDMI